MRTWSLVGLLALAVLWGCSAQGDNVLTGGTGGGGATNPITLTVNFPPARGTPRVASSDQFQVDLREQDTGTPVGDPLLFDRDPPGTAQQTVRVDAPPGLLDLRLAFLEEELLVGTSSAAVDTRGPVAVTVEAEDLFTELPAAEVSTEPRSPQAVGHPAGFAVVWAGLDPNQALEVFCRRYSHDLVPQGTDFQVNTSAAGNTQLQTDVAADGQGNLLVVWDGFNAGTFDILARRYGPDGQPSGPPFVVNSNLAGTQFQPRVDMDAAGNAVVAWTSFDGVDLSVAARRLNAQGIPQGVDLVVTDDGFSPTVATVTPLVQSRGEGAEGGPVGPQGFVVGYGDDTQSSFLQAFDAQGMPLRWSGSGPADDRVDLATSLRSFVIPHVLEKSGTINNVQFTFDTTIFATYTAFNDTTQAAVVNFYVFDPVTGLAEAQVGNQVFLGLTAPGLGQTFAPSNAGTSEGVFYTFTGIDGQAGVKQVLIFQSSTGATSLAALVTRNTVFGFMALSEADDDVPNVQGMVVTSHSDPFDVSVFGFEPQPITGTGITPRHHAQASVPRLEEGRFHARSSEATRARPALPSRP